MGFNLGFKGLIYMNF